MTSPCRCEHWQTCPTCFPQGFDEHSRRLPAKQVTADDTALLQRASNDLHMILGSYGRLLHPHDRARIEKTIAALSERLEPKTKESK